MLYSYTGDLRSASTGVLCVGDCGSPRTLPPTNENLCLLFSVCSHIHNLCPQNKRCCPRRVFVAARAKPTIDVGRFCGRGMGALREGIRPFPEVVLCFISVDTEMKRKNLQERFCVFAQHKSLYIRRECGSPSDTKYRFGCSPLYE